MVEFDFKGSIQESTFTIYSTYNLELQEKNIFLSLQCFWGAMTYCINRKKMENNILCKCFA